MQKLVEEAEYSQIKNYCEKRYGVSRACWDSYVLIKKKEALWLCSQIVYDSDLSEVSETIGLRVFSGKSFPFKITDAFLKVFKEEISDGILKLKAAQLRELLFSKELLITNNEEHLIDGYVVIQFNDDFIGIGLKRNGHLLSQVPKKLTAQLSESLELCDK